MDKDKLDKVWLPHTCSTIQEYLQRAYGRLDQGEGSYAFRGVASRFPQIWASIDRREIAPQDPVKIETRLLEEFLLRASHYLTSQERKRYLVAKARWRDTRNTGTMVVARHRMVPTRCIDWTYDPLCSLLFACEDDSEHDGEVWWFNRTEFDYCVGAQWPALFGKRAHVEDDIEKDFIEGHDGQWFTALNYMLLADDRLDLQRAWITVAGHLGACHAEEIHRLGVRGKGRLVIPAQLKAEAMDLLGQMGITRRSPGFARNEPADLIGAQIEKEFERDFPSKS